MPLAQHDDRFDRDWFSDEENREIRRRAVAFQEHGEVRGGSWQRPDLLAMTAEAREAFWTAPAEQAAEAEQSVQADENSHL